MRIMYYLLREESLFVLDPIPKEGCLKMAKNIAKCEGKINFYLLVFTTQI